MVEVVRCNKHTQKRQWCYKPWWLSRRIKRFANDLQSEKLRVIGRIEGWKRRRGRIVGDFDTHWSHATKRGYLYRSPGNSFRIYPQLRKYSNIIKYGTYYSQYTFCYIKYKYWYIQYTTYIRCVWLPVAAKDCNVEIPYLVNFLTQRELFLTPDLGLGNYTVPINALIVPSKENQGERLRRKPRKQKI